MKRRSALRIRTGLYHFLTILAASLMLAWFSPPASANEKYSALVIDANSGRTLFAENADARRYPASLTKMMTLYVLFEELDAGRVTLATRLPVSANAARQPPSKLGLKAGTSIKVEDAILALVTKSANDVAVVVAERIGGSVSAFATRMNRTARAIGMAHTTFRNPHGLPDGAQFTTARDMARLARALQDRFPSYYSYFGKRSFTYRGVRHRNHNRLLGSVDGVDGIKTGYTRASGFNLVTNVRRGGRHIVAVVMGGRTAASRDRHMRDLIAKYLPKASRGDRTDPVVIADSGAEAAEMVIADARLPRSRPEESEPDASLLGYAPAEDPQDVVMAALSEAEVPEGDVSDAGTDAESAAAADDPIALRIESASAIAQFADIELGDAENDPIGRLTELARIRAGVQDVIAGPVRHEAAASSPSAASGWYIQIGAVPTEEGAQALIERAQKSMGTVLASLQPVMQEVDRDGTTLYRARFAGFSDKEEARATCAKLKRKDFSCLAVPN